MDISCGSVSSVEILPAELFFWSMGVLKRRLLVINCWIPRPHGQTEKWGVSLVRRLDSLMGAVSHIVFIKYSSKSKVCRETTITTSTKRPEGTDCWQRCCLRWFSCVSDFVWKRLSLHECFLSLRAAFLNVFCCILYKKKKKEGGRDREQGRIPLGFEDMQRFFFLPPFLISSCFIYFLFLCNHFLSQMFLYHCNCGHRFCLYVFVYLDCVGWIYLAHISPKEEKEKKPRMYWVLYPGNLVLRSSVHIMRL